MATLDHVSLAVRDWHVSRDWYMRLLGLKLEFEVPQGGATGLGVAALQDDAGLTLFLEQVPDDVHVCGCINTFQVADVEGLHAKFSASDIRFLKPPRKLFWGYGAEIADPDGHVVRLWDEKSMRDKGGS
ncbi:MAG: VOC family protein [Candidatus Acidiferrales bacterium]